jgi:hypothetical protein
MRLRFSPRSRKCAIPILLEHSMLAPLGVRFALILLAAGLAGCASDDEPFDHVADCQTRMARGSPNEEFERFTSGIKTSIEHTEVFLSAEYPGSDGKRHKDYFHCSYVNDQLVSNDRRPAAPGEAKAPPPRPSRSWLPSL